jgi:hypothetical protein
MGVPLEVSDEAIVDEHLPTINCRFIGLGAKRQPEWQSLKAGSCVARTAGQKQTERSRNTGLATISRKLSSVMLLETSFQFPVVMNSGPLVLRTDRNILVSIRYLY